MESSLPTSERIPVASRAVESDDALLALLPASEALISWVQQGEGMVAWGELTRIKLTGSDRFTAASHWWRTVVASMDVDDHVQLPGTGPVAFGSFAFNEDEPSLLVVPRVIVGRRNGQSWITWCGSGPEPHLSNAPIEKIYHDISWKDGALSATQWQAAVAQAVSRIQAGDLDKVVLAREVIAQSQHEIDIRQILSALERQYPSTWTFALDGLVGATPELLLRLSHGQVTSRVLAGTIGKSGQEERDMALAASLVSSPKDLEEHAYAVASVAQSLSEFCSSINIPDTPFVLDLSNVMHLASDVTGVLKHSETLDAFTLLESLHPSAAVCGTPRAAARKLIAEIEGIHRARYSGPIGWIDSHGDGEFGIALRCAQIEGDTARLFAGCGIVAGSDPEAELAESQAKLMPMRMALESN